MKEHENYLYRFCSVTLMITFNILQQKSVKNNLTVTAKSSIVSSFFSTIVFCTYIATPTKMNFRKPHIQCQGQVHETDMTEYNNCWVLERRQTLDFMCRASHGKY